MYLQIINTLEDLKEEYSIAEGLLSRLKSIHFVGLIHFFSDLLSILEPINNSFQKKNITISEALIDLQINFSSLEELVATKSVDVYFRDFCQKYSQDSKFMGISLKELYGIKLDDMKKLNEAPAKSSNDEVSIKGTVSLISDF